MWVLDIVMLSETLSPFLRNYAEDEQEDVLDYLDLDIRNHKSEKAARKRWK